jgi:hypothetical protein
MVRIAVLVSEEERLVAELELLDIHYLSRQTTYAADRVRPEDQLVADVVRQSSARVRQALIALFLAYPEYARAVPAALTQLAPSQQLTLRLFYTAAVLLQQEYVEQLSPLLNDRWYLLPDLFSADLGIETAGTPQDRLRALGSAHCKRTGMVANWTGTYENVVRKLVRSWQMAGRWNR